MPRLFTAIRLPPDIADLLLDTQEGVEAARWQDDEQLHLTLTFLGDVTAHAADDLVSALSSVPVQPFELALRGVGHFEHKSRVRALWADVAANPDLAALQQRVAQACAMAGCPPEARRYLPHVTLARLSGPSPEVPAWLARHARLALPAFTVRSFALMASTLTPNGSHYTLVEQFPV
ncbi:MAG: RNA 2',3'-cyclic phosphodiesterase [Alteraurantiacibacter sp.]